MRVGARECLDSIKVIVSHAAPASRLSPSLTPRPLSPAGTAVRRLRNESTPLGEPTRGKRTASREALAAQFKSAFPWKPLSPEPSGRSARLVRMGLMSN